MLSNKMKDSENRPDPDAGRRFFDNPTPTEWGNLLDNRLSAAGRQIHGDNYEDLAAQLKPREHLFGFYWICTSGDARDIAPHIDSEETFIHFEKRVFQKTWCGRWKGEYNRYGFFAIPEEEFLTNTHVD